MHDRASGGVHEVEQLGRRALAVQLGEKGEHAAAETNAGKGRAGRAVQVRERRRWRPGAAGQDALEVADRTDGQCREHQARVAHQAGEMGELGIEGVDAFDHDFELALCAGPLAQNPIAVQFLAAMPGARIELADQQTRCGPLEQVEIFDGRVDLLRGHAETCFRHALLRRLAERDLDALARCGRTGLGRRADKRDAD